MYNYHQHLRRCILIMQVYNFKICHKKDSENVMADALLRLEYEVRNEM